MRKNILGCLLTISFTFLLLSGCAKDQVKPDEGMTAGKTAEETASSNQMLAREQAAAQKAALEQAAAQKAAQEASAQAAALEQAAAQKAALEQAAAQKAAMEQATSQATTPAITEAATTPLNKIHFDFDSYVLTQPSRDTLYNNAEYLLKKYHGKVKVEGHCDERGTDEYNLALGENRAKTSMNYLITLGVPAEQLSVISYGEERPLDNGHTEEAWAKNRRVEFVPVK